MNTIGKILVILNFVFAIAVGGFLVFDFARRSNWKDAYDKLKSEMDVLQSSRTVAQEMLKPERQNYKVALQQAEEAKQQLADKQTEFDIFKGEATNRETELNAKLNVANLTTKAAIDAQKRLQTELADRDQVIQEREKAIAEQQKLARKYHQDAVTQENYANTLKSRLEQMQNDLIEKSNALARQQAGVLQDLTIVRNPNEPNPPPVDVRGVVEKVDSKDPSLVQISVGSDHGIGVNHTLQAYRLKPSPQYLGMVRVVETYHRQSVGRLVSTGGSRQVLREGDEVASKIK